MLSRVCKGPEFAMGPMVFTEGPELLLFGCY